MRSFLSAWLGVLVFFGLSTTFAQYRRPDLSSGGLLQRSVRVGGLDRTFVVFVPSTASVNKRYPLVFVFHGGGGSGRHVESSLAFSELAEREKFIAVYPDGVGNGWNDGRESVRIRAQADRVDDLGFVEQMITVMQREYAIDEKRIYATGISNGGIFTHYVGANLSEKFAAIAPVVGGIAEPFVKRFAPKGSVSVLIIQGTDDALVPYDGGPVARNRGNVVSTDEAVRLWAASNKTDRKPVIANLPDMDRSDGCTAETYLWTNGKGKTEVKLFKLIGGGHTWPGSAQNSRSDLVGNVCRDFGATATIWEFFKGHPKQ
jgi:polyhydroxybutyrate depolymerase